MMNRIPLLALPILMLLPACGGGNDPTPEADESASPAAINASVEAAQNVAAQAQLNASGQPDTREGRINAAENMIESSEERGTAGQAREGASGLRPSPVDPAIGDPLQVPR